MSTCECTWRKSISCESTPSTPPHVHIPPNSILQWQGMVSLKNSACLHVEGHMIQVMQLLWLSHWQSCWTSVIKHAGDYSRSTDATCKSHTHTLHTLHTRAILTRAQTLTKPCPCATCNWLLHPAPTSAQDGLDLCNLRWLVVSILPSISANTSRALAVDLQLVLVVLFLYPLVH